MSPRFKRVVESLRVRQRSGILPTGRRADPSAPRAVFLVTSTLRPTDAPLQDMPRRSLFGPDERLEQTLETLTSIRARVPSATVVLLENSEMGDAAQLLERAADELIWFGSDPVGVELREGVQKGAAEAYMLLRAQEFVAQLDYDLLFKLSGRYSLTESFDVRRFPRRRFGFLRRDGVYSTRLYSVPRSFHGIYVGQLEHALRRTQTGEGIERVILEGVPRRSIKHVRPLGVRGYAAPKGNLIEE